MPAAAAKAKPRPKPTPPKATKLRRIPRQRAPMLAQEEWPQVDQVLVEFLERSFPPLPVRPGQDPAKAMYEGGRQEMIALLRQVHDRQRLGAE